MREIPYQYLMGCHNFTKETLDMLDDFNLYLLVDTYRKSHSDRRKRRG